MHAIGLLEKKINENRTVKAEVRYDEGGWKTWSGLLAKRGYYLMVYPVDGARTQSNLVSVGMRKLLKETSRFSKKALNSYTLGKVLPILRDGARELNFPLFTD